MKDGWNALILGSYTNPAVCDAVEAALHAHGFTFHKLWKHVGAGTVRIGGVCPSYVLYITYNRAAGKCLVPKRG